MTDALPASSHFAETDFRVGRVFERTFSVLFRNLLPFCLVTTAADLPPLLLFPAAMGMGGTGAAAKLGTNAAFTTYGVASTVVGIILSILLYAVCQAVLLYGAFEDMRGRRVNLIESIRIGLRRFFPIIGVGFLTALLAGLAGILLIIPGLIVLTMLFVSTPVCVVEKLGPIKSMGRSADLTKGHRWKVFGLWVTALIVGGIMQAMVYGAFAFASRAYMVMFVVHLAAGALFKAFYAIVGVVAYHDLRVAKEGVDTNQIAAVFD